MAWQGNGKGAAWKLTFKVAKIFMFSTKLKTILVLILLKPHDYGVYILIL
jgi:hypothetical protein